MNASSNHSTVAVTSVRTTIQDAVREALELVSWKSVLEKGRPTSLKVNLGWELFIPGSITSPWVLEGVISTIRGWVGPIYVVESDQVLERIEVAYRRSGMPDICRAYDVKWVNMSNAESVVVDVTGGVVFQRLELPKILLDTQVVTIPVMKTHAKTQITGAVKNQWGCISKLRHNYHLVLSDALADINSVVRPRLALMDATVGLEGNGPKSGIPKVVHHVLASTDIVAVDTIQATMMGLDPSRIDHLRVCAERGIGTNDMARIDTAGTERNNLPNLSFVPAKHNLVSRIEELLRRSRFKRLFFDTPVFSVMLWGAKFWYIVWFHFVSGKKHWGTILQDSFYGPLWRTVWEKYGA